MQIYLMRHGPAESALRVGSDAARPLSAEGREKVRAAAIRAREAAVRPGVILTSPLLRARESAEIAAAILNPAAEIIETKALEPESSPQQVWDDTRVHRDGEQVLLIGHEPLLSTTYAFLLDSPSLAIHVSTASLGRIDIDAPNPRPHGILRWFWAG